jgi:YD repeat-containing protein
MNRQTDAADLSEKESVRTRYFYDTSGNKLETQTGWTEREKGSTVSSYTYDRFSNVLTVTDALGQTETNEYDKTGLLIAKTDRNGSRTEYTRDAAGRVTFESDPFPDRRTKK